MTPFSDFLKSFLGPVAGFSSGGFAVCVDIDDGGLLAVLALAATALGRNKSQGIE